MFVLLEVIESIISEIYASDPIQFEVLLIKTPAAHSVEVVYTGPSDAAIILQ